MVSTLNWNKRVIQIGLALLLFGLCCGLPTFLLWPGDLIITTNASERRLQETALVLDEQLSSQMVQIPDLHAVSCKLLVKQPVQLLPIYPHRLPNSEHTGRFVEIFDTLDLIVINGSMVSQR